MGQWVGGRGEGGGGGETGGRALGRRCRRVVPRSPWGALTAVLLVAACARGLRTQLVIYSPHGRDLLTVIQQRFEALPPDVAVRWLDMGSQEVYDRVRSERANPQADVWFGGPATIFALGAADSLLEPFRPSWAAAIAPHGRGPGDRYWAAYEPPPAIDSPEGPVPH